MADTRNAPRLDGVRESIREPLRLLTEHLRTELGENLQSITVVGSSLTEDFQPTTSDINTVIVLETHNTPALSAVAALAKPMSRYRFSPPLLMTPFYIDRSRDVFGIEFLDFQLIHETILGDDPFAFLHIEKQDVRLQCEREIKAMLVRLRQGYLAATGDKIMIRDLLISTAKGLTPLLRAMLWLKDHDRPKGMDSVLRKAADVFETDLNPVLAAEQWRSERKQRTDAEIESTFAGMLAVVDHLTTVIDGLEL
jgi:hypothetical protein